MRVTRFRGGNQANCYLAIGEKSKKTVIIDPGYNGDSIFKTLQEQQLEPVAIFATHGHFDQVMASKQIQEATGVPFYIHKGDKELLNELPKITRSFSGDLMNVHPAQNVIYFDKEQEFEFDDLFFEIILTPGHTLGSVSYYWPHANSVFCGDVLQAPGGCGRIMDWNFSSTLAMLSSINRILGLPFQTVVYCGHGKRTTVAKEAIFWKREYL